MNEINDRGVCVEAIASGFQPDDAGSSPAPRSKDRHVGVWAICLQCGNRFASYKHNGKWGKFCNTACSRKYQSENVKPDKEIRIKLSRKKFDDKRVRSICKECGAGLKGYQVDLCKNCRKSKTMSLTDSKTIGEMYRNGYGRHAYQNVRNHAQRRADFFGMEKKCPACGYTIHVELCHIKSIGSFPKSATLGEVNKRENLVYLCPTHHWEFDNGILDLTHS